MNPNDQIRQQILQYFYDRNSNATSRMGKKGSAVKIMDIRRELKKAHSLTQQQVMANLTYLVDNNWVKTVEIEKTVKVRGGTIPQVTTFYEITATGIDKIEGGSQFEPQEKYSGINITATGNNVITLGDGNVVNVTYQALHTSLNELKNAISQCDELEDSEKLDIAVDIESIKDQLAKSQPNKTVVGQLWKGLERISTLSRLAETYNKVNEYIAPLIS